MNFDEYQKKLEEVAIYPGKKTFQGFVYCILGISGEAGEISEKVKKIIRDKNSIISEEDKKEIQKEIGDVLWYLGRTCEELEISLNETAKLNLEKLFSRKDRGVLKGNGDNR